MKWFSSLFSANFILIGFVVTLGATTAAIAQTISGPTTPTGVDQGVSLPAEIDAALSYPNSSQRFFEEGNAQFEEEIQLLLDEDGPTKPILTVHPEVLEQFEDEFEDE